MAINIVNEKIRSNNVDLDANYGPYESVSEAHSSLLDNNKNKVGVTVGIKNNTTLTIEEYWYQGGTTETHLVKKETDTTQLEQTVDGINENYLKAGQSSGSSSVDFDAFADTIHNNAQTLSSTQKQQARQNIDAQKTLESGVNIKTINEESLIGSGNITIDYSELNNQPQINSITLSGNKSASTLGLATAAQGTKADNAIPMPTGGSNEQILAKDSSETGGVKWVPKPSDGKSAYQVAVDNGFVGSESEWLASLKAQFGSFVPADYGTDGKPASGGTDITASASTTNYIYLVDNLSSNPTAKVMWITVVNDSVTPNTYSWQSIGEVQVSLLFKSGQSLDDVNIVNDFTTGGVDNIASAETVKVLGEELFGRNLGEEIVIPWALETNKWKKYTNDATCGCVSCFPGANIKITAKSNEKALFTFVTRMPTNEETVIEPIPYAGDSSRIEITAGNSETVTAPSGTNYLVYNKTYYTHDYTPASIELQGAEGLVNKAETLEEQIEDLLPIPEGIETLEGKVETLETDVEDLNIIIVGSQNLGEETIIPYAMENNGTWVLSSTNHSAGYRTCAPGSIIKITAKSNESALFAFITAIPEQSNESIAFANDGSRQTVNAGESATVVAPADTVYLAYNKHYYAHDYTPESIVVINQTESLVEKISKSERILIGTITNGVNNMWERGGIDESTGKMLTPKTELDYERTIRTKNYIRCNSFYYEERQGEVLTVFQYANDFSFVSKSVITDSYSRPTNVEYIKLVLFKEELGNEVDTIELTCGNISSSDGSASTESVSYYAHSDFLDLDNMPFDDIWFDESGIVAYYYDSSYAYLKPGGNVARYAQWSGAYTNAYSIKSVPFAKLMSDAKYCRLLFSHSSQTTIDNFNVRFTKGVGDAVIYPNVTFVGFEEFKNEYIAPTEVVDNNINKLKVTTFFFDVKPTEGFSVTASESEITPPIEYYSQKVYFGALKLVLPPNYTQKGQPTKLIIWCQGSGDYITPFEEFLSNSESYNQNMMYWLKSGYAIASVWVGTSKYVVASSDINGKPSDIASYESAYRWIVEHYNIDDTGCYVGCKSMGGVGALNILYSNIPVKAADLFAPALNPFYQQLGYSIISRREFVSELNLDNCEPLYADDTPSPMSREDFNALMIANKFKMQGHNAYFAGVTNKTFEQMVSLNMYQSGAYDDVIKVCKVPLRIHIAVDDTTVMYQQSLNIVKAIKNANCVAEIRTLPAGCVAPHHATDSDANALRVSSITTKLGYELENIALAYVEAIDWFENYV